MPDMDDPFADPTDTREAILGAAFRVLRDHGCADLTIERIGEAFDKSPSLVYHHYDGKDELLVDLLEFLLDGFESTVSEESFDLPPRARLDAYVTAMTDPTDADGEHAPGGRFLIVIVQLRAQAAVDDAYRDHFDRSDRVFGEFLERSVRDAAADRDVDDGHDVDDDEAHRRDPAAVAATIQTLATGAMFRWATTADRGWVDGVRSEIDRYLSATLPMVDPDA